MEGGAKLPDSASLRTRQISVLRKVRGVRGGEGEGGGGGRGEGERKGGRKGEEKEKEIWGTEGVGVGGQGNHSNEFGGELSTTNHLSFFVGHSFFARP